MFSGMSRGTAVQRAEPLAVGTGQLDVLLGGGIPRGQVVEISGGWSSGKASLGLAVCLRSLELGQAAAWIDPGGGFWPVATLEAGSALDRLLVVRVPDEAAALRAAHILLASAGAVASLVVDLPRRMPPVAPRPGRSGGAGGRSPWAARPRELVALQRLAERSATALVFLTERTAAEASLGAQVALRLHVSRSGAGPEARMRLEVLRNKQGASQRLIEDEAGGPDRMRLHRSL
jgi:recombination protein RecA